MIVALFMEKLKKKKKRSRLEYEETLLLEEDKVREKMERGSKHSIHKDVDLIIHQYHEENLNKKAAIKEKEAEKYNKFEDDKEKDYKTNPKAKTLGPKSKSKFSKVEIKE